ncbi:MAG: type II toxin-antitoxin system VapC family toxin [Fimbriimonadaceae bacterium]|nr:type II toxin-antitoxin system VapC family toxin [Fimbriimonadaceae bacterium]
MRTFVLDASVALTWLLGDGSDPIAERVLDRLKDRSALVPAIWELEVANGLVVAERTKRSTLARSTRFLELLAALPIETDAAARGAALLPIARKANVSVYDAGYLELAMRTGAPLATIDRRLKAAAETLGVASL